MIDAVDARYRALFETTPDGIMIVNDEGVYIDLNDAMCAMLGASREELIGRHFRDFMPDGRIDDAVAAFGELRERGGLAVEFPVRRADGTFLSLEWRSRANFLPGLHLCIARDVSALRESEERYRAFVANSTEAIWRFELEVGAPVALPIDEQIEHWYQHAYLAECNEAMARMYGFASAAEIAGARMGQMLVREDPNNIAYLRAFAESGYRLIGAESHEVDRDGNEKYFVNNLIGIVENGFLVRAWGTQRDVTEQHAIESARSALLDRLEFLADVSALLGASLDYDETLRATAQAAVPRFADWCFIDVMNVTGEMERVAAQPSDPQDALEPAAKIVVPLIARGRTVGALTFANSESGRTFTEEHVRLAEDIGRRAGLAIDNARLYSELERANRAKDEFLAMLSHELRTPMTATLGWATMLKLGNMPQDMLATAAESIAQSTRAQARLVDDLLDISRIVTGKMQLSMRPLTVFDAIAGAVETIRPAADAKQIVIDLDIRARDARIVGDAERLQQVLWNLLSNAVKFTPRLGSVCVELSADADAVRIAVRDTGEGIAPELLPFIFDRFRQGDSGASRRFGGLGLGLAIARNLVEMHGGTITATSRGLGHGAELTVVLPAARETSDATASIVEAKEPAALEGLSLLVVEDDDSTRAMFDAALRQFGASVVSVGTTSAARDALSSRTFDAIVSDIGLPGEDGIDFLRGLRASGNRVPSIAVTAYAGSEERTRAFDAGFNVWLTKPIEPETLVNEVRNAVRMYHRTDGH